MITAVEVRDGWVIADEDVELARLTPEPRPAEVVQLPQRRWRQEQEREAA